MFRAYSSLPIMTETERSSDPDWTILFFCWLLVAAATLGSLFFSEVMELPPCSLCWVQRIFMFPLAIILLVGLFPFDPGVVRYALPLAAIGGAVALYHLLLQFGIIGSGDCHNGFVAFYECGTAGGGGRPIQIRDIQAG